MMDSTVNERIMDLVNFLSKGNKSAFSKSVGISNQSLAEILGKRQSAPSFSALQKIFLAFPQIRMEWLVLGEGEMLQSPDVNPELSPQELEEAIRHIGANQSLIRKGIGIELRAPNRIAELEEEMKWSIRAAKRYESEIEVLSEQGNEIELIRVRTLKSDNENFIASCQASLAIEREAVRMMHQEIASWSYRVDGQADITKPYGGLLSCRLGISTQLARQLSSTGKILNTSTPSDGYCISENAVRAFIHQVAVSKESYRTTDQAIRLFPGEF
jgi:hypothetical protein